MSRDYTVNEWPTGHPMSGEPLHCPACDMHGPCPGIDAARLPVSGESEGLRDRLAIESQWLHSYEKHGGEWDTCQWQPCELDRAALTRSSEARTVNPEGRSTDEDGLREAAIALEKVAVPPDALMNQDSIANKNLYDWWHERFAPALRSLRAALSSAARLPVSGESEGLLEALAAIRDSEPMPGSLSGWDDFRRLRDMAAAVLTRSSEARTEPDWRAVVHEAMRRYHLPNDSDERVADIAIGAMEEHGFAAPRTEPAMPRPRGEWDIESTEGLDLDRSFRDRRDVRTEPETER